MNRYCIVMLIMLVLNTSLATAQEDTSVASHKETLGFGIGALVGGLIAGPPGAVIGAAGGTLFGNHSADKDRAVADLAKQLQDKNIELAQLQNELANTQSAYSKALQQVRLENKQTALKDLSKGISFSIYFRTDKSEIDHTIYPHIQAMVGLIRDIPQIKVELEAYTDHRGQPEYNMTLSQSRARAVQTELIKAGLPSDRIQKHAYGESRARASKKDYEGYVFDRRVDIHLTLKIEV